MDESTKALKQSTISAQVYVLYYNGCHDGHSTADWIQPSSLKPLDGWIQA